MIRVIATVVVAYLAVVFEHVLKGCYGTSSNDISSSCCRDSSSVVKSSSRGGDLPCGRIRGRVLWPCRLRLAQRDCCGLIGGGTRGVIADGGDGKRERETERVRERW